MPQTTQTRQRNAPFIKTNPQYGGFFEVFVFRNKQFEKRADFSTGAYKTYVTEKKRKRDDEMRRLSKPTYNSAIYPEVFVFRNKQFEKRADFSTGAYKTYVTEKKRKRDDEMRRLSKQKKGSPSLTLDELPFLVFELKSFP